MAASAETLGELHSVFATYLADLLKPIVSADGDEVAPALSSGHLAVIAKFLKDNNVTSVDGEEDSIAELRDILRSRATRAGFSSRDVDSALEDAAFLSPGNNTWN